MGWYVVNVEKQNGRNVVGVAGANRGHCFIDRLVVQIVQMIGQCCQHVRERGESIYACNLHAKMAVQAQNVTGSQVGISFPGTDLNPLRALF